MRAAKSVRVASRLLTVACLGSIPACASFGTPGTLAPYASELNPSSTADQGPTPIADPKKTLEHTPPEMATPKNVLSLPAVPAVGTQGNPLPITLPHALALADANPLDVEIARERVDAAQARMELADLQWLPNITLGVDYYRHDGQIQDIIGSVFTTSRSALLLGGGPQASISVTDAVFAPLATAQLTRSAQADLQATRNDATLAAAVAYFNIQQARGEVAGSVEALRRAEDLVVRTEKLAPDLVPGVEVDRVKAEAARRRIAVESAYERWQTASADLSFVLRLRQGTMVEPAEEPAVTVSLIDPAMSVEDLIAMGLTHRPELQSQQAVVQAALVRVQQEKRRPLYPTLALRSVGSNTPGMAGGYFGGGINDDMGNFGGRLSMDLQAVWELQNLGLGNRALVKEREAVSRRALSELMRTQEAISADIAALHAQLVRADRRRKAAEDGLRHATLSAEQNLKGLGQTKRAGDQLVLVFRPQEVVASVSALDQAYRDFYVAVGDHNRAQFRLYRALGHPGKALCQPQQPVQTLPGTLVTIPTVPSVLTTTAETGIPSAGSAPVHK